MATYTDPVFLPIRPQESDPKRWVRFALYPPEYDLLKEAYDHAYGKQPHGDDLPDWCFAIIAGFAEDIIARSRARKEAASQAAGEAE